MVITKTIQNEQQANIIVGKLRRKFNVKIIHKPTNWQGILFLELERKQ